MKVTVSITANMPDSGQWTTAFGLEGASAIRQDVKRYIGENLVPGGVFANGEVDAEITWR